MNKKNGGLFTAIKSKNRSIWQVVTVLIIMILIQSVIIGKNVGFGAIFSKIGMAWLNVLRNNTYAGIIALGMCFIVLSGGIDISVGSALCASGAFLMWLIDPSTGFLASVGITGIGAYIIAIVAVLCFGTLLGWINGIFISLLKIPPFIVTLGTMKIFRSVTQQLTRQFNPTIPADFKKLASFKIGGQVILPILYWLVLVAVLCFVFKRTAFGRHTVAIGSNERAAKFSGINVNSVKQRIYALGGLMCAIAAIIYVARIGSMDFANAGSGYEMDAIAAVVVGGTAMSGGRGSVFGTFLGMLIISIMNNILNSVGVPTFLCDAVRGAIIIFAVLLQRKKENE